MLYRLRWFSCCERGRVNGTHWKPDREGCALIQTGACSFYVSSMQLDDMFNQRQTQPQSPGATRARHIALAEVFEDMRQELRLDPFARIVYDDLNIRVSAAQRNFD